VVLPRRSSNRSRILYSRSRISHFQRWILLGASIGALSAAALFLYRRNLFDLLAPLVKVFGSTIQPPAAPSDLPGQNNPDDADNVELAAFAPQTCGRGEIILVQALLHLPADREPARLMAVAADPATVRKAAQTLSMAVRRGEKLDIDLEADGCRIDEARQTAIWRGEPVSVQFFATVPRQRKKPVPVRIAAIRSGVPVGSIRFTVPIEADASKKPIELRGEFAKRFERAFVSYASEDRVSVLEFAQVLNISGIEIFQDVLSLEPGDRWERRLYGEIDRSDLFLLFWSKAASKSKWVVAETEYALRYYNKTGSQRPVIRPILLEGPPIPKIPATLKSISTTSFVT
jgi:TIR domain